MTRVTFACWFPEDPGASASAPQPPAEQPPASALEHLVDASQRYVTSLGDLAIRDTEVMRLVVLLHAKLLRIADGDEALWELDTVPNLLLIERTLGDLRAACRRISDASASHEAMLRAWLAPLLARITPATRASIEVLARAGRAPSPFSQDGAASAASPASVCRTRRPAERS